MTTQTADKEVTVLPPSILSPEFLAKYKDQVPPWGFNGLGYIVYKRTYSRIKPDGNTEEWADTLQRCIDGAQELGADYTVEEAERLFDHMFNLRCFMAGRMLWQFGTETVRKIGVSGLLNCWFIAVKQPKDFCFIFDLLMLGGGVGFSVRGQDIHELPKVKKGVVVSHEKTTDADFIIPDSREGWVGMLSKALDAYFVTGKSFTYSTILVRSRGERIHGFGGTASGPAILVEGLEKICSVLDKRAGKKLRSIDVLDICNIIGSIVVAGNVRRSAQIAIGDPDDVLFLRAKRWDLGNIPNWRAMSNNTIYADDYDHIMESVWDGYSGNGEPYGFFNLPLSQSNGRLGELKEDHCEGTNPCFAPETLIVTERGLEPIKELVGREVTIWTGTSWRIIDNFRVTATNQPILKVTLHDGSQIRVTPYHTMILENGKRVEAKDLVVGDRLEISTHEHDAGGIHLTSAYAKGFMVGDGTMSRAEGGRPLLWIYSTKANCETRLVNSVSETPCGKVNTNGLGEVTVVYDSHNRNRLTGLASRKEEFAPWCSTYKHKLPAEAFQWDEESRCEFLAGLFDADGTVMNSKNGYGYQLSSISRDLLLDVQILLKTIGVQSKLSLMHAAASKVMPGGTYDCQDCWRLTISQRGAVGLASNLDFSRLISLANKTSAYQESKTRWNRVVSVEPDGVEPEVYCCTVSGSHSLALGVNIIVGQCAEVSLNSAECCNLAELCLNNISSEAQLIDCAKLLYKTQKAVSSGKFIHDETNKIVHKNMRLGLGVTGICQSFDKLPWLDTAYRALRDFDETWSKAHGWPASIKLTVIKPSGTLSLLSGATPGGHPAFARYYIRRVRMASEDKLIPMCRSLGYHVEWALNFNGTENRDTMIVEFPCTSGDHAILAKDLSAVDQLELVKKLQTVWADNAVSVTVYYRKEELPAIKDWMREHYATGLKSVSFLLHSDHGFVQAPYEEISEDKYRALIKKVKPLATGAVVAGGDVLDGLECAGGSCPIK